MKTYQKTHKGAISQDIQCKIHLRSTRKEVDCEDPKVVEVCVYTCECVFRGSLRSFKVRLLRKADRDFGTFDPGLCLGQKVVLPVQQPHKKTHTHLAGVVLCGLFLDNVCGINRFTFDPWCGKSKELFRPTRLMTDDSPTFSVDISALLNATQFRSSNMFFMIIRLWFLNC